MTASQIRDVVLQNAAIEERVAKILEIRRTDLRKKMATKPFIALHLVPLVLAPRRLDITLPDLIEEMKQVGQVFPPYENGRNRQWQGSHRLEGYQLDEWISQPDDDSWDKVWNRIVFRRDGSLEFVDAYTIRTDNKMYRYTLIEKSVHIALKAGMTLYDKGIIPLPIALALSLENLSDVAWPEIEHGCFVIREKKLPNGSITPDPVVITELSNDYRPLMKPIWDFIWNAGGKPRCEGYDEKGKYKGYDRSQS